MRKLITGLGASALAVVLGAIGVDTGAGIYAEYQLARHVRAAAGLNFDPWVAILGFPFIPQAMRHRYDELEIKAGGVEHPVVGKVTLEATMHDIFPPGFPSSAVPSQLSSRLLQLSVRVPGVTLGSHTTRCGEADVSQRVSPSAQIPSSPVLHACAPSGLFSSTLPSQSLSRSSHSS